MTFNPLKLVAGAALVAGMAFGGAQLASAQADPSTSTTAEVPATTEAPAANAPAPPDGSAPDGTRPHGCQDKDKAATDRSGTTSGTDSGTDAGAATSSSSSSSATEL